MKTKQSLVTTFMVASAMVFNVCMFTGCKDDDTVTPAASYSISGNGSGSQVVPAVNGTGSSTISGTYDPNTRLFTYNTGWNGLTGAPTGGGFYSGASGATGTAVGTPWTFDNTATGTGTYSGSMTLTQEQGTQLTNRGWYYGYNTAANTGGEVRGQIAATR